MGVKQERDTGGFGFLLWLVDGARMGARSLVAQMWGRGVNESWGLESCQQWSGIKNGVFVFIIASLEGVRLRRHLSFKIFYPFCHVTGLFLIQAGYLCLDHINLFHFISLLLVSGLTFIYLIFFVFYCHTLFFSSL